MEKVIISQQAASLSQRFHDEGKRIVVAGGCFDILHPGHITFLRAAKEKGDVLILLLESDETIKRSKGNTRPFQPQKDRAFVLSALEVVNNIILLEPNLSDSQYDELILALKPAIIATTEGDASLQHKKRQAAQTGARLEEVSRLPDYSTSLLAEKVTIV